MSKRVLGISLVALFCFFISFPLMAEELTVESLIKEVDRLYRAETSYAEMEMTIVTPNWERTMKMEAWTEGMDKTFITILEPKKDKGISTLRVEQEMWNYFPKINKVMKVPPSMMMGSWMGSDFTNDDLVKESTFLDDYQCKFVTPEGMPEENYYVELLPKEQTATVWGRILVVVAKEHKLPLRYEYYDEKGEKMRVMEMKDIKDFGDRTLPATLEMVPLNKENHKTTIRYVKADFNQKLDESVFTLRNLQKRR